MKKRIPLKIVLIFGFLCFLIIGATVYYLMRNNVNNWSEILINGRAYRLKLTEFEKPVEVGVGSPALEKRYQNLLGTCAVMSDPVKYSYEEACKVATNEVVSNLTREKYDMIKTTTVKANPAIFQKSVDYAVEVIPKAGGKKYLVLAHRYGYNLKRIDGSERMAYKILIWVQDNWKSFPPVSDDVKVMQEDIKFGKLLKIRELVAGTKAP